MLSSSHKQLLCFVWICLNLIIFHFDIAFSRRLDRQHWSPEMQRRKELKSSLSFRLSYMVYLIISHPRLDVRLQMVMHLWRQKSLAADDTEICQKQCRGSGQHNREELQDTAYLLHHTSAGQVTSCSSYSVLETKQLFVLLLEGADEMVWGMLVGSY